MFVLLRVDSFLEETMSLGDGSCGYCSNRVEGFGVGKELGGKLEFRSF